MQRQVVYCGRRHDLSRVVSNMACGSSKVGRHAGVKPVVVGWGREEKTAGIVSKGT